MSGAYSHLNFLARKDPKNFNLFIRFNSTYSAFWAVTPTFIDSQAPNVSYVKNSIETKTWSNDFRRLPFPSKCVTVVPGFTRVPAIMVVDDFKVLKGLIEKLLRI